MNKIFIVIIGFVASTISLFSEYNVGDVCSNISWTDDDGLSTSIYDQVDQGKAVLVFWGRDT